jgi:acetylornithine/succinyldiaminopimelate/putrescine aminotransferase/predicted amino acid dehydrogenase
MTPLPTTTDAAAHAPRLHRLLRVLGLDVTYARASGDYLFPTSSTARGPLEPIGETVLDLVGGYGCMLLGHNHPALVEAAVEHFRQGRPTFVQGSVREPANRLAATLARRAGGGYSVVFTSTGAEAVEAAIKHAMLQTGCRTFIALDRSFHGKTLGALQLTASAIHREPFLENPEASSRQGGSRTHNPQSPLDGANDSPQATGAGAAPSQRHRPLTLVRVPANDLAALEAAFASTPDLAAFIVEPIQGEGGVRAIEPAFAQRAAALCRLHKIPLIADEIQTGSGRTGRFTDCQRLGIRPDYLLLGKALGGGIAKVAALLIDREQYRDEFDLKHSSTFAADGFSCAIALKTLELIDEPLLASCRRMGERLRAGLRGLMSKYPAVLADVRGEGLMIGVELARQTAAESFTLRYLCSQRDLALVVAGYLLNVHRIRIAPTLSDPHTLRLAPSALLSDADADRFLAAMGDVCAKIEANDAPGLTAFLSEDRGEECSESPQRLRGAARYCAYWAAPARQGGAYANDVPSPLDDENDHPLEGESDSNAAHTTDDRPLALELGASPSRRCHGSSRVAWLCHLIDADDLPSLEPGFASWGFDQRERYLDRVSPLASPVVMSEVEVRSKVGSAVTLYPIMLPVTSAWMKRWIDARQFQPLRQLVQAGVDLAASLGCSMVSLGQYTSIATHNGTKVSRSNIGITTGNSYSVALAIEAVEQAMAQRGVDESKATLAIVGAAGNIGRVCALTLGPRFKGTILVGSDKPGSPARLRHLAGQVRNATATCDASRISQADVVIAATNAVDAPLRPEHFAGGAIVCDISVPGTVDSRIGVERPDVLMIKGGIARLPGGEDLQIVGFPQPVGTTYGCMAEGLLLGLENIRDRAFTGSLDASLVQRTAMMAARHGFELANYKTFCVFGSQRRDAAAVTPDSSFAKANG